MTDAAHSFAIPGNMRAMAEAGLQLARRNVERLMAGAEAAAGSVGERTAAVQAGARDVGARAISYAERNLQSSLDHAQSMARARNVGEMITLHGAYLQSQMAALTEQTAEMAQIVGRVAADATKTGS